MGSIVAEIADKIASAGGGERSELEVRGGTGADGGGTLTLSTSELTVVDGDKLGRIDFQAPLETGTDAIVVSASIWAEADDTFAADNNSTELVFAVGASEAAAEKMRLDSAGQLGIGVTTPASLLHVAGTVQVGVDDTGHDVKFFGATSGSYMLWDESTDDLILGGAARLGIGTTAPDAIFTVDSNVGSSSTGTIARFHSSKGEIDSTYLQISATRHGTPSVQRVQLQAWDDDGTTARTLALNSSGGNVGIGTSAPDDIFHVKATSTSANTPRFIFENTEGNTGSGDELSRFHFSNDTDVNTGAFYIRFRDNNSYCGGISSGGGSSVSFDSSSDYRLKENVTSLTNGLERVLALKPKRFNFISNKEKQKQDGFIAHEVSEASEDNSYIVTGKKDAMTEPVLYTEEDELPEGKSTGDVKMPEEINPQGLDYGKFTPMLVSAIQELSAKVTALENA